MKPCDTPAELEASLWRIGFLTLLILIAMGAVIG